MSRKIMFYAVLAAFFALPFVPPSLPVPLDEGFLPRNDLRISVNSLDDKGVTKAEFDQVLGQIQAVYGPIIAARGGRLVLNRLWDDDTVNALSMRDGKKYIIEMYGGLARHEAITQDGLTLVACHELGHHLGGAPKFGIFERIDWASNEGQSDYFAGLKCLRLMFASPGTRSFTHAALDDAQPRAACERSFSAPADRDLCVRAAIAGMSVTSLFRIKRRETVLPRYDTPDPKVVDKTRDKHPATQCRLDTYFSGTLCPRPISDALDEENPASGTCTRSQGFTTGLRPLCWYKPPNDEPAIASGDGAKTPRLISVLSSPDLWKGL